MAVFLLPGLLRHYFSIETLSNSGINIFDLFIDITDELTSFVAVSLSSGTSLVQANLIL